MTEGVRQPPERRDALRAALRDPRAVRQAILLAEVLGPPVAQRARTDV